MGAGTLSRRVANARGRLLSAICASKVSARAAPRATARRRPGAEQPVQFPRADEGRLHAGLAHHREIARELDRVAEAVVVQHQHAFARAARPLPGGKAHAEGVGEGLAGNPARLVTLPALFEVPEHEVEASAPAHRLAAAERLGGRERGARLVQAIERAQRQRLAAQGLRETGAQQTGAAKRGQRLLVPAELQQGGAEIERGLGKIRAPLQRLARRAARSRPGVPANAARRRGCYAGPRRKGAGAARRRTRKALPRIGRAGRRACPDWTRWSAGLALHSSARL